MENYTKTHPERPCAMIKAIAKAQILYSIKIGISCAPHNYLRNKGIKLKSDFTFYL